MLDVLLLWWSMEELMPELEEDLMIELKNEMMLELEEELLLKGSTATKE